MFPQPKRAEARLVLRDRVRDQPAYAGLSDLVLAVRAKDGDDRALETLVERHAPGVRRLAGYLLSDHEDAEDAAQEALAKLCTRIGQFRGEARFQTWLYSLVSNTCRDLGERQRRRRHQPLDQTAEFASDEVPQEAAEWRDQRRHLAECMRALSDDQRRVMVLKDVLQLSYEEIAQEMGMPVGTVKCHAHRGRVIAGGALPLGRDAICDIIPHREPFLLVDEITELEAGVRAVGSYHVRDDAWYLAGHFPGNPIMPGVLQVEALAQVGAICGLAHPDFAGRLVLFAGIDDVRFKRVVRPGDTLDLRCEITRLRGPIGRADAEAKVGDELACRGTLTFALVEGELE